MIKPLERTGTWQTYSMADGLAGMRCACWKRARLSALMNMTAASPQYVALPPLTS